MALIFSSLADKTDLWREALLKELPDLDFRVWPDADGDPADIDFALMWKPKPGALKRYPNLSVIFSLGAGVDHLLDDADLPRGIPVVRLVDRSLTAGMTEYVAARVLYYHRDFHRYEAFQRQHRWNTLRQPDTSARRVGILGMGVLGADAAATLRALGFSVSGWSRSPKDIPGVACVHGEDTLIPFLGRTDILVCLLPLTPATRGILDARVFHALPRGAYVINPARGGHVVDADLIAALDEGHIAHATLDVFHTEPLPDDHPFWSHPGITVTPHAASLTVPGTAAGEVAENIRRFRCGEPLRNVVDMDRGY